VEEKKGFAAEGGVIVRGLNLVDQEVRFVEEKVMSRARNDQILKKRGGGRRGKKKW